LTTYSEDEKISNVVTELGEESNPRLPKGKMDIVLMVNVLHYFDENEQRVAFLKNIIPSIKPTGILVIVQWKKDRTAGTNSPSVYNENIKQAGYEIRRTETFLPKQVIFTCHPDKDNMEL
jgi:chemotaxis methyl-accepting protein methylase